MATQPTSEAHPFFVATPAIFLVIAVVAFVMVQKAPSSSQEDTQRFEMIRSAPVGFPDAAPAPSKSDLIVSQQSFQYLVSWGSQGPEPMSLSISAGETVRFTNVGNEQLHLTVQNGAASVLERGAYWQVTFDVIGTYEFRAATGAVAIITVE